MVSKRYQKVLKMFKRQWIMYFNGSRCFLWEEYEENINHLLVHCKKVIMLWDLFLSIVGTSWVFPNSVIQTLLSWQGAPMVKNGKTFGW